MSDEAKELIDRLGRDGAEDYVYKKICWDKDPKWLRLFKEITTS